MASVRKNIMIILIVLLIGLIGNVYAEEIFTLHSGVTFGMSTEEVIACEAANGFVADYDYAALALGGDPESALNVEGKIAGISDSRITYNFYDKSLYNTRYSFSEYKSGKPVTQQDRCDHDMRISRSR